MFEDIVRIKIKAGDGGDGAVSFRREKFVAAGGPDGGDGGRGGDVIFKSDTNISSLIEYRYRKSYKADDGMMGSKKNQFGKKGESLVLKVPVGTIIKDALTGTILADISDETPVTMVKGGKGGWGNAKFATPTRQVPMFAKSGIPGEETEIILELKLLADVGLVGFPNVGKSTLISVVSSAKPKIANYHFTTLQPNLGVVRLDSDHSFVMADIPGLIEDASEGKGLGHEFLRHIERCRMILHLVDVSGSELRDPKEDFDIINYELANFNEDLADLRQIVVGNKTDIATDEQIADFKAYVEEKGYEFMPLSAVTTMGSRELINKVVETLSTLPPIVRYETSKIERKPLTIDRSKFSVTKHDDGVFEVEAPWLLSILQNSDMDDYSSLQYFQTALYESGIIAALVERGVEDGDLVMVYDFHFEYLE